MPRATPLPPDERRALLVTATAPLLQQHGRDVSTRQIAEAAGVAEGTIFRVFPTKDALIDAVIDDAFDIGHTIEALEAVPEHLPLEDRLVTAVDALQERLRQVFALFHALRLERQPRPDHDAHQAKQRLDNARLNAALADLLVADRDRLRLDVLETADILRTVTFAMSHPLLTDGARPSPAAIVDVVLHGVALPLVPTSDKEHVPC